MAFVKEAQNALQLYVVLLLLLLLYSTQALLQRQLPLLLLHVAVDLEGNHVVRRSLRLNPQNKSRSSLPREGISAPTTGRATQPREDEKNTCTECTTKRRAVEGENGDYALHQAQH